MRSRDIEPNPKLDSAQFFYQNPKLDYALSNCGQLLTDAKLRPSDMEMDPKLDSSRDMEPGSKLSPAEFFIESNQTTNKAGQMTGDTNPNCFVECL